MPGLYVHVPFCLQKCAYCAFYSVPIASAGGGPESRKALRSSLVDAYFEGLVKEIGIRQQDAPLGVSSLFIGGGTPTALSAEGLERLLRLLSHAFVGRGMRVELAELGKATFSPGEMPDSCGFENIESTTEANPGTITSEKLRILRRYGINRISLGAQTFSDPLLKEIGRIHNAEQIRETVRLIRSQGFSNLNLDLMFGLPGQSLNAWQESVEAALRLGPEHLSLYALSIEEGTPLAERYGNCPSGASSHQSQNPAGVSRGWSGELQAFLPDDDEQADMYEWAVERLKREGYIHYEVSNFALPGKECRHNLEIWRGGDYVGLGPGAVSTIKNLRWRNYENVEHYAESLNQGQVPLEEREILTVRERMAERVMLGLRLREGLSLEGFKKEFGESLTDIYQDVLETYLKQNLLTIEETSEQGNRLRINPRYIFTANAILQGFM